MDTSKLNSNKLREYQNYLLSLELSTSTIKRKNYALKKFFSFLESKSLIEESPFSAREKLNKKPLILGHLRQITPEPIYNAYKNYSSWKASKYLHLGLLVVFSVGLGIGIYNQLTGPKAELAEAYPTSLTRPRRYLSFQGRLTDTSGNPISVATDVVFKLYNVSTGGSALWNSGTCSITPDQDGIFSTKLGSDCGSEIDASIFTENQDIWLEITVGTSPNDEVLTPRIQIATVGYALNAETLQGYPASSSATKNTIPVIDNSGNLVIGSASPTIQSTSGTFAIEGNTGLVLQTASASDSNITLAPDGDGVLNLTLSASTGNNINATNSNIGASGGKEANNLYYGYVGNDNTNFNLLKLEAGSSKDAKFTVDYAGNASAAGILKAMGAGDNYFAGNIGIGTTGPTSKLHVVGSGYFSTVLNIGVGLTTPAFTMVTGAGTGKVFTSDSSGNASWSDITSIGIGGSGTTNYLPKFTAGTTLGNSILYETGGNIGIGTTAPGAKLEILGAGTGATFTLRLKDSTGADKVAFLDNGNVGIGTTNPGYKLDVSGTGRFTGNLTADDLLLSGGDIYPTADSTTAIQINKADGTTNVLNVDTTNGRVGIGTTGPGQALDVVGKIRIANSGDAGAVVLREYASGSALEVRNINDSGYYAVLANYYRAASQGTVGAPTYSFVNDGNTGFYQSAVDHLGIVTGGAERIRVQDSGAISIGNSYVGTDVGTDGHVIIEGNVGIGTTSPGAKLEINGGAGSDTGLDIRNLGTATRGIDLSNSSLSGNTDYFIYNASNKYWRADGYLLAGPIYAIGNLQTPLLVGSNSLVIRSNVDSVTGVTFKNSDSSSTIMTIDTVNDLVGIGTTAPSTALHINDGSSGLQIGGDVSGANYKITRVSTGGEAGYLKFYGGQTSYVGYIFDGIQGELMRIDRNGGNVGIGTTNPLQKLQVAGDINIESGSGVRINNTATSGQYLRGDGTRFVSSAIQAGDLPTITTAGGWTDGGSSVYLTASSDNVGIGTSSPSAKLEIIGAGTGATFTLRLKDSTGADKVAFLDNGNVGIGTTGPGAKLEISNTAADGIIFNRSGEKGRIWTYNNVLTTKLPSSGAFDITNSSNLILARFQEGGNVAIGAADPGTAKLYVSGNVGIGTTSPSATVDIAGNLEINTVASVADNNSVLTTDSGIVKYIDTSAWDKNASDDVSLGNVNWILSGDTGTAQTINVGNTATVAGGNGILTTSSATDTLTIDLSSLTSNWDAGGYEIRSSTFQSDVTTGTAPLTIASTTKVANLNADLLDDLSSAAFLRANASDEFETGNTLTMTGTLDVNGELLIADTSIALDGASTNFATTGNLSFNSNQFFLTQANGNIGIGTSSPGAKLEILGAGTGPTFTLRLKDSSGADKVAFLDNGNVGIGTTSPGYKLDVSGDIRIASGSDLYVGTYGLNDNASSNSGSSLVGLYDDSMSYVASNTTVQGAIKELDTAIGTVSGSAGGWTDGGSSVYLTTSSDNVGIGTSSPANKLSVSGNMDITGNLGIGTTSPGAGLDLGQSVTAASGGTYYSSKFESNYLGTMNTATPVGSIYSFYNRPNIGIGGTSPQLTNLFVNYSSANVGIGTTTTVTNLYGHYIDNPTLNGGSSLTNNYGLYIANQTAGTTDFALYSSGGTNYFGGNVGIGTTAPAGKLQIVGSADDEQLYIKANGTQTSSVVIIEQSGGSDLMRINNNGLMTLAQGGINAGLNMGGDTQFYRNAANVMRTPDSLLVDTSIGIGTTAPYTMLDTAGAIRTTGSTAAGSAAGAGLEIAYIGGATGSRLFSYDRTGATRLPMTYDATNHYFNINGSEKMRIDSNGNVGIGTTSPSNKVEIAGGLTVTSNWIDVTSYLGLRSDSGIVGIRAGATTGDILLDLGDYVAIRDRDNSYSEDFRFDTDGNSWLDSGNVGIGTTAPSVKLDVNGDLKVAGNDILDSGGSAVITFDGSQNTSLSGLLSVQGAGNNYFAGNVGIGITTPSEKLDVRYDQNGTTLINIENQTGGTGAGVGLTMKSNSSQGFFAAFDDGYTVVPRMADRVLFGGYTGASGVDIGPYESGADIRFFTGLYGWAVEANERMRIDSTGNVGIGTTAPGVHLDIQGSSTQQLRVKSTDSGGADVRLLSDTTKAMVGTTSNLPLHFYTNNAANMVLTAAGNVGIGTTSPGAKLEIIGAGTGSTFTLRLKDSSEADTAAFLDNGNVGIGTTAPGSYKLSVAGDIYLSGDMVVGGYQTYSKYLCDGNSCNNSQIIHGGSSKYIVFNTNATNQMILDSGGNLGIGTTGPSRKLEVSENTAAGQVVAQFENTGSTSGAFSIVDIIQSTASNAKSLLRFSDGSNGWVIGKDDSRGGIFGISTGLFGDLRNAKFAIDTSGNVGIGTTSPGGILDVSGYFKATSTSEQSSSYTTISECTGSGLNDYLYGTRWLATPITPGATTRYLTKARIVLARYGNDLGNIVVEIQTDNSIAPSGTIVTNGRSSVVIPADGSTTGLYYDAYFDGVELTANTKYWLVVYSRDATATNTYRWPYSNTAVGTNCQITAYSRQYSNDGGATWSSTTGLHRYILQYSDSTSTTLGNLSVTGKFFPGNRGSYQSGAYIWSDGSNILTNGSFVTLNTIDLAESFPTYDPSLEAGDLVASSIENYEYIVKTNSNYSQNLVGIISTRPGITLGRDSSKDGTYKDVALAGRVPTKVLIKEGESIKIGDAITSSTIPGVGKKATKAGGIVGKALENFNPESCQSVNSYDEIDWSQNSCFSLPNNVLVGKILVYLNVGWWDPQTQDLDNLVLDSNGDLLANIKEQENGSFAIEGGSGESLFDRIIAANVAFLADLKTGVIETRKLIADKITTKELISPTINSQEINTKKISLAEIAPIGEGDVEVNLQRSQNGLGKLIIKGENGEAVVSIDASGSAEFANKLKADSLQANQATVSGTLTAEEIKATKIDAQSIVGLEGKFDSLLSASTSGKTIDDLSNRIEKLENYQPSPPENQGALSQEETSLSPDLESLISQILNTQEATPSSQLNNQDIYIPNYSQAEGQTELQALAVYGATSLADTTISGYLSINGTLSISGNSIDALTDTFYINPMAMSNIDIMAGKVTIDRQGNAVFKGDLSVEGTLKASRISPQEEKDILIKLANSFGEENQENGFGKLLVEGENQEIVASIDASGSARFSSLSLKNDQSNTLIASSQTLQETGISAPSLKTNATTGIATLPQGENKILIYNSSISDNSLIYITPTSDTNNKVLFVEQKKAKETDKDGWFVVSIDQSIDKDIEFNWWIIN